MRICLTGLLLASLVGVSAADSVSPKSGKKLEGALVKNDETQVVINIYWSRNPGVTNPEHVFSFPRSGVKKVQVEPRPLVELFRRLADANDAEARYQAGLYAKEHKLKHHARLCFGLALAMDPKHRPAMKALGGPAKWKSLMRGNPTFDVRLEPLLQRYAEEADVEKRKQIAKELKALEFKAKPHELERYRRSALQPTGYQENRPLSWNAPAHPGAVYTLFVPRAYKPHRPWPLVIGLHGGGPDGAKGDEVVGSGPSAMNFYRRQASKRGFLVACPDALQAGWGAKPNEQLVRDVVAEVTKLYHVDMDRIYLTGHSMGGFGTWALGPRLAEEWAAVSPMAGAGGGGVQRLVSTRTPIFIFHSEDDFIAVQPDRTAAKALKEAGADFVYTEFANAGHGFPDSVQTELFDFFTPRRRWRKGAKDLWPLSSFRGSVTKTERLALGDPQDAWNGTAFELKAWLAWIRHGGSRALEGVAQIVQHKPEGAAVAVAKLMTNGGLPFDARGYAARCVGELAAKEQASALAKALIVAPSKDQSFVAKEVAGALGRVGARSELSSVNRALELWTKFFESKVGSGPVAFSDWERSLQTLAPIAKCWGALLRDGEGAPVKPLLRTVVSRILEPDHEVRKSERVPQDPSRARAALAGAVAQAFAAAKASDDDWTRLIESVESDPRTKAAVTSERH